MLDQRLESLDHPVYQKPARGGHMSKSLRFFDFGGGSAGGSPTERKKRARDLVSLI